MLLKIRPNIEQIRDEHGWSISWLQYVNRPKEGLAVPPWELSPGASEFDFMMPDQWQTPNTSSSWVLLPQVEETSSSPFPGQSRAPGLSLQRIPGGLSFTRRMGSRGGRNGVRLIRSTCPIPPVGKFVFKMQVRDQEESR